MDFKFWGAAPGGFFENPTIFGVFGLGFPSSGVRLVCWPLPLGRWPHSGDTVSCFFSPVFIVFFIDFLTHDRIIISLLSRHPPVFSTWERWLTGRGRADI